MANQHVKKVAGKMASRNRPVRGGSKWRDNAVRIGGPWKLHRSRGSGRAEYSEVDSGQTEEGEAQHVEGGEAATLLIWVGYHPKTTTPQTVTTTNTASDRKERACGMGASRVVFAATLWFAELRSTGATGRRALAEERAAVLLADEHVAHRRRSIAH